MSANLQRKVKLLEASKEVKLKLLSLQNKNWVQTNVRPMKSQHHATCHFSALIITLRTFQAAINLAGQQLVPKMQSSNKHQVTDLFLDSGYLVDV